MSEPLVRASLSLVSSSDGVCLTGLWPEDHVPTHPHAALAEIERLVGASSFSRDPQDRAVYGKDMTDEVGDASAVVFPRTPEMVAALLKLCNECNLAVVPSGGRTGLAGGARAIQGELILSLDKLTRLGEVDTTSATLWVEAGVTTQRVHEHCQPHGLTWPIDLASKGTSQIGGNIATNAGGVHVIRYGMTREWVRGMQVATMDGRLLNMERNLVKNNTSWDPMQLFIGSEGTLGVVTSAILSLAPLPRQLHTVFLAIDDFEQVIRILELSRSAPFVLHAYEFLCGPSFRKAIEHFKIPRLVDPSHDDYVLLEFDLGNEGPDALFQWLESTIFELVVDGATASSEAQRRQMWLVREGLVETYRSMGRIHAHDVSVPVAQTGDFVATLRARVQSDRPEWRLFLCGHVGDGNVHPVLIEAPGLSEVERHALVDDYDALVFDIACNEFAGSISAEHGVGLHKRKYLHLCRSEHEREIFSGVKQLLDPRGLLNPGKILI